MLKEMDGAEDQRIQLAQLIKHHGLELSSDWLESPPAQDAAFLKKLQEESRKAFWCFSPSFLSYCSLLRSSLP